MAWHILKNRLQYPGELEDKFKAALGYERALGGFEKNKGRKSRAAVPIKGTLSSY
jgi:hypothetical protein